MGHGGALARSHERHRGRTAATQVTATLHRMSLADHTASRAKATAPDGEAALWDELLAARRSAAARPPHAGRAPREPGGRRAAARQDAADLDILAMGITFTVYSDGRGIDRAWPFDVIPRVIDATEWRRIEAGLVQRLQALNRFIDDLYNEQQVVADGVFPAELLADVGQLPARVPRASARRSACGPTSAAATSCATPTARVRPRGQPAGAVGRQLPAREPARLQAGLRRPVRPPEHPARRRLHRRALPPAGLARPRRAWSTRRSSCSRPGIYNSAYFEHSFLAQRMGVPLVEGRDLFVGRRRPRLHAHHRRARSGST